MNAPAPETRSPLRKWQPGMRVAVLLPDGQTKEIPQDRIRLICIGDRLPDELPMTGYRVIVL